MVDEKRNYTGECSLTDGTYRVTAIIKKAHAEQTPSGIVLIVDEAQVVSIDLDEQGEGRE